jgi:hypothetical protein
MSRPWRVPRITPDDADGKGKFSQFAGLVNTQSRKDFGLHALYKADNVFISDSKKVTRRDGYSLYRSGNIQSAFGLNSDLYVVDSGQLLRLVSPTDAHTLITGLTGTEYGWGEINNDGYFVNGVEAGIVRGDTLLPWRLTVPAVSSLVAVDPGTLQPTVFNVGQAYAQATWRVCATYVTQDGRETAPSDVVELVASPTTNLFRVTVPVAYEHTNIFVTEPDGNVFRLVASVRAATITFNPFAAGRELTTWGKSSLPTGVYMIDFFQGRCYAAEYVPEVDTSVVWMSEPLGFHLFNQAENFILLPGKVGLLAACNEGMLCGTTSSIKQYTEDGKLNRLASYGVVPGTPCDIDAQGKAYFWTERGICEAMPFKNLSEETLSMPPGLRAATRLVYFGGKQQFIVVTQGGGEAFNARTERVST